MQFQGFVFGHIEIEVHGFAYDLHNFYQVSTLVYDIVGRSLILGFTRRTDTWVPAEQAHTITVSFREVDYFSAGGRDENPIADDDQVLDSIGVVEHDAETQDFYLTDHVRPDHHLVMRFASGLTVRIQAAEARCEIVSEPLNPDCE